LSAARINSASSDVKNIALAIVQFNTDTKTWPIYKSAGDTTDMNTWDVEWTPATKPA